jgi:hypothetical protein
MKKVYLIIIIQICSVSCVCTKTNDKYNFSNSCFERKQDDVYLNFVNNSSASIFLPNLSSLIDENFYLQRNYYKIDNDTLIIRSLEKKDIYISDLSDNVDINIRNNYIEVKAHKVRQQFFKIDKEFNHILIDSDHFNRCK